jgi:hypothetical protein
MFDEIARQFLSHPHGSVNIWSGHGFPASKNVWQPAQSGTLSNRKVATAHLIFLNFKVDDWGGNISFDSDDTFEE